LHIIGKNILFMPLILLIASIAIVGVSTEPDLAVISTDPLEYVVPAPGETFTIDINVYNVTDLGAYSFKLGYNTTLLDAVEVTPGPASADVSKWLPIDKKGNWVPMNDTLGRIWVAALIDTGKEFTGNGTLVTINFTATELGNCTLHFYDTELTDGWGTIIDHDIQDGEITVIPPPLPVISLNPSEYTAPAPGESSTIDVNITDVINLQHYEFKLWFNTTLLNATGVTPGSVNPAGTSFIPAKMVGDPPVYEWAPLQNVSDGFVWAGASLPVGQAFTGSGILMTVSFTALTAGNCTLHLNETVLVDSMEVEIDHLTLDGFVTVMPKIGEFHTHHINDATDDFPNDYMPMVIPINGRSITIAPVITCTAFEDDVFVPYHYPCKLAQTLFADDDWTDKDANYTYVFEDWNDYDWNDIVVSLHAVTNDIIDVEIHLESREAAWKNPFSIEITPVDIAVEVKVYWNSTDYPEEHTLKLNPGETVDIELFAESNPCDNAFITIIPLIPPVASFVYSPLYPRVCENVTFNASASTLNGGYIISYEWDFGDASPKEFGIVVTHHYAAPGTYNVTLNVTDSVGVWDTETKTITVTSRTYTLIITTTVGGTTVPIPGSYSYDEETIVSVTATPEANHVFDHWELDGDNVGDIGLVCILLAAMAVTISLIRRRIKTLKQEH